MRQISGTTVVAGVAGSPVRHSLSPLIHNAWLAAAGIDGVYVPFEPPADHFDHFVEGLRGAAIRGLNVTIPFKEVALSVATEVSARAQAAAAANLLIFQDNGAVVADNTDGVGLLEALRRQAPGFDVTAAPIAILGAGGGARGAAAALLTAGAPEVRILNRTLARAEVVAGALHGAVKACPLSAAAEAFEGVGAVINATSASLTGDDLGVPLEKTPEGAVVMDMVYDPLLTPFLEKAQALGRRTVDGLEMLIRQAAPSFEAFYGRSPPAELDVRSLALERLGQGRAR